MPRTRSTVFVGLAFVLVVVGVVGGYLARRSLAGGPRITLDLDAYESILASTDDSPFTRWFPGELPPSSKSPAVSFYPGFLQGGGWFIVTYVAPPTEIAELSARAMATGKAWPDDLREEGYHSSAGGIPQGFLRSPWEVHVATAEDKSENPTTLGWNHGSIAGLSIDREHGRVVHWYYFW